MEGGEFYLEIKAKYNKNISGLVKAGKFLVLGNRNYKLVDEIREEDLD